MPIQEVEAREDAAAEAADAAVVAAVAKIRIMKEQNRKKSDIATDSDYN